MKENRRIGYACMNLDVMPDSFRTCRIQNLTEEVHRELIRENLAYLEAMIDYNGTHGARLYRVSSSLIPFATHERMNWAWQDFFAEDFHRIAQKIKAYDLRISVHPGQYTVINSKDAKVVTASVTELEYHADLLELLGATQQNKMILHVGGVYGDKVLAMQRFIKEYEKLSSRVRRHLVIENDDKFYTLEDVLSIASHTGVPVVFDNLHHKVNPSFASKKEDEVLAMVMKTWRPKERPKIHYSQQAKDKKAGAHTETIDLEEFVKDYETFYQLFELDIMLEVKDKNRSFKKVDAYLYPSRKKIEQEWARYKYSVMSKSYADYTQIRRLMGGKERVDVIDFYERIDASLQKEESLQNLLNTMQHIWGYFKKQADEKERKKILKQLQQFENGTISPKTVGKTLRFLSEKYGQSYLQESYFLKQY